MSNSTNALPLFYHRPRVLQPGVHSGWGVKAVPDFLFARETNSLPLGGEEFFEAQAHFPIVFSAAEPVTAVAVLGLDQNRNLFVDGQGRWKPGAYIPAYIRRYPFVFVEAGEGALVLGVDEQSPAVSREGGEPLFDGAEPSALTKRALDFCSAFQGQDAISRELAAALKANDLLVPHRADIRRADNSERTLSGFTVVDEQKFAALPDDVFLDWRRRNWLALIYAHLLSQRRWNDLAALPAT